VKRHGHVVRNKHGKIVYKTEKVKQTKPTTLVMPTEFVGQNGAAIHENTPVAVTGCSKAKPAKKHKKKKGKKKGGKGGKKK
ncbi:MAG TPA: hypothetical protein VIJ70_10945, partial [Gaiellaceae bacterium]